MPQMPDLTELGDIANLSEEDILYFRDNPKMLDVIGDRETINTHVLKKVLWLAVLLVIGAKLISYSYSDALSQFINDVVVDIIFELGAALLGAVATVYFVEIQQKRQFEANFQLRKEIERKIAELQSQKM